MAYIMLVYLIGYSAMLNLSILAIYRCYIVVFVSTNSLQPILQWYYCTVVNTTWYDFIRLIVNIWVYKCIVYHIACTYMRNKESNLDIILYR